MATTTTGRKRTSQSRTVPAERKNANAGPKPKIQVVEYFLHFESRHGHTIVIDLDFPSYILRDVMFADDDMDEQQQFAKMLEALGDAKIREQVDALGAIEYMQLITGFFEEFGKLAGVDSLGESVSSSDSSTSTDPS